MLKVGLLGFGAIARGHLNGYEVLEKENAPVRLAAVCDINPKQLTKVPKQYHTYPDLEEMLRGEKLDVIDICLPSYLHAEYAIKLLERGYHVQVEKPMALCGSDCDRMLEAAEKGGKKLMVGMCLRFDSTYLALKHLVDEKPYGEIRSVYFERLSKLPDWGWENWFHDFEKAGGVAFDMHIHDVDMTRFLFGEPQAVRAEVIDGAVKCITATSRFQYPDYEVTALGDWGKEPDWVFQMSFSVQFERAEVRMDHGVLTVIPENGEAFPMQIEARDYFAEEIGFFARTILGLEENQKNRPEDAAQSVRLVEKLIQSAENGEKIQEG